MVAVKNPLEPLMALDDLKKVLAKIVAVPKDTIGKAPEPERPKRERSKKPAV